ncbi:flagellar assembly protein FliW [Papillibacter cinnamivorans]|uniref:Flagellar assembly factor FliW n=1 Tax=Papillibacter cinnamivorans DSM 12816 TaxID=1122930 RepID=A0A1W1YHG7_9FIRM|nr:flagellar assembly protein FliW [Papillibacter cinnamivorans]SMC35576.1 flagellar assembly factor FliW [Papillibacter cinnamivorans DSM 12816]
MMIIKSMRFGDIEIDEAKVISFPQGIPGLEYIKRFALIHHDRTYPINWLQAVDDPMISLPVIEPFQILRDYVFDISDNDVMELSLKAREDLHVINVLVIPEEIENMTVNLAAPILINTRMNLGKQIIIDRKNYSVRSPAFHSICKIFKEVQAHAGLVQERK